MNITLNRVRTSPLWLHPLTIHLCRDITPPVRGVATGSYGEIDSCISGIFNKQIKCVKELKTLVF